MRRSNLTERSSCDLKIAVDRRYRAAMTDERTGYARPSSAANSSVLALVLWGWFVWGGRIRNVNADATLRGGDYWGPMLLSTSFVLMGAVVAVAALAALAASALRAQGGGAHASRCRVLAGVDHGRLGRARG